MRGGRDERTGSRCRRVHHLGGRRTGRGDRPLVAVVRAARAAQPGRTTGGTRRYSQDDLRRLRRIAELVADGVNLTGIGKILDLEQDTHELRSDNTALRADNTRLQADTRQPARPGTPGARTRNRPGADHRPGTRPTDGHRDQPPDRADRHADQRQHDHQRHHEQPTPSWTSERTRVMPDPAQAAITALTGSTTETVGRFSYDVPTDTWWWSTSLYTIHGFTPGEIVPTTALMMAHQHPDDRAARGPTDHRRGHRRETVLFPAPHPGRPATSPHRRHHRRRHPRRATARSCRSAATSSTSPMPCTATSQAATRLAVELSAETRAAIEQAKGALMITYGLDEDEAFALLRWHSQHSNIKLRDIAAGITDRTNDPDIAGLTADGKITEILADLTTKTAPATDIHETSQAETTKGSRPDRYSDPPDSHVVPPMIVGSRRRRPSADRVTAAERWHTAP